jgi:ArsR family transcriptional regulator, arsenate/arsenite/antimonite-responsive transcriptional repressor / arsenate reductase (thioredoxin)
MSTTMQQRKKQILLSPPGLPILFDLLSHRLRWAIVQQLASGDVRVNEIVSHLREPMNVVSYHLKKMRDSGLIVGRRSEADARDVYYQLDLARLKALYAEASALLHPAFSNEPQPQLQSKLRILFVSSSNSARSQMAEGWLRHLSEEQVEVASAGINPGTVHSEAIRAMQAHGIDISGQRAKNVEKYAHQPFDLVITVCDIAREEVPTFDRVKRFLHWGMPNPLKAPAPDQKEVYDRTAAALRSRVLNLFQLLPHLTAVSNLDDPTKPAF